MASFFSAGNPDHYYTEVTDLCTAAAWGLLANVKLLVEKGGSLEPPPPTDGFESGFAPIHQAAARGHGRVIEYLVREAGDSVDRETHLKETPLHVAAEYTQPEAVLALVRLGANVNALNKDGRTPLFIACRLRDWGRMGSILLRFRERVEICIMLLDAGAFKEIDYKKTYAKGSFFHDRDAVFSQRGSALLELADSCIPEMHKSSVGLAKLLIESGADANVLCSQPRSVDQVWSACDRLVPIHVAVARGNLPLVRALLTGGCNPSIATTSGSITPLHVAAGEGNVEAINMLAAGGANLDARSRWRGMPLHLACLSKIRSRECVDRLLDLGADIDALDPFKRSALHLSLLNGVADEVIELLIERGANVNLVSTKSGAISIHVAIAKRRSSRIIGALLSAGANIFACNKQGRTPLYFFDQQRRRSSDLKEAYALFMQEKARRERIRIPLPLQRLCWIAAQRAQLPVKAKLPPIVNRLNERWLAANTWACPDVLASRRRRAYVDRTRK